MHQVTYDLTFTKNLGNFENVKIEVGLKQDGQGHPDVTLARVRKWVEENLEKAIKEVVEALEGN